MSRSEAAVGVAAAVLLVAGVILAVVTARRDNPAFPQGSPQAAISTYLGLLQSGDVSTAYAMTQLYSPDGSAMGAAQFHAQFDSWNSRSHRVSLVSVHRHGSYAEVTVDINTFSDSVLNAGNDTSRQTFTLMRSRGRWEISGPPYLVG